MLIRIDGEPDMFSVNGDGGNSRTDYERLMIQAAQDFAETAEYDEDLWQDMRNLKDVLALRLEEG